MYTRTGQLPHLSGLPTVTDGGLETDIIFNHGIELPEFAAFPLLENDSGRQLLASYYDGYARIAEAANAALLLETPTWCAHIARATPLGYNAEDLHRINKEAVMFLSELRDKYLARIPHIAVLGTIGPRGDGYGTDVAMTSVESREFHRPQLVSFAEAGADGACAYTIPESEEAIGISLAARDVGIPIGISFTVETNGFLHNGTSLGDAILRVQALAPPDWFMVNCAHPSHIEPALTEAGEWAKLIRGVRCNASRRSQAELDAAEELDAGNPKGFGEEHVGLRAKLPELMIFGGCCGTDSRHVASLWGIDDQRLRARTVIDMPISRYGVT